MSRHFNEQRTAVHETDAQIANNRNTERGGPDAEREREHPSQQALRGSPPVMHHKGHETKSKHGPVALDRDQARNGRFRTRRLLHGDELLPHHYRALDAAPGQG